MSTEIRALDTLVPYWRNPRRMTDEAVNAIGESLKEFGYNQPIVVDEAGVIIIGHTRYAAMRRLGVTEAPVRVVRDLSQQQIKQLRIIDNRSAEFSLWDIDLLIDELEGSDSDLMRALFPEIDGRDIDEVERGNRNNWTEQMAALAEQEQQADEVDFVCPQCFHGWTATVTREDVLSGRIEQR